MHTAPGRASNTCEYVRVLGNSAITLYIVSLGLANTGGDSSSKEQKWVGETAVTLRGGGGSKL